MEFLFWFCIAAVFYVYIGYPIVMYIVSRGAPPLASSDASAPSVALLISAYNEVDCIEEKLRNSLELEYPVGQLNIIVISDASSDGTDDIVTAYQEQGVALLRMASQSGKTVGLNAAVERTESEVIVFSDANAMYRKDAIRALVRPFSDQRIGAVVGEQAYLESNSESSRSESLYWRYETKIKEFESARGSVVGGDGAIYAIRRCLYEPMKAEALSDFVNPLQVVRAGYRCVYTRDAVAYEEAAADFVLEYRRKVRIVNRAWRAMMSMREMLNPFAYGVFSIKLWSHKVLRWVAPIFLVSAFVTNIWLLQEGVVYRVVFFFQCGFYTLALVGALSRTKESLPKMAYIAYYFCLVNFASAKGIFEACFGETYTMWSTHRTRR